MRAYLRFGGAGGSKRRVGSPDEVLVIHNVGVMLKGYGLSRYPAHKVISRCQVDVQFEVTVVVEGKTHTVR